ncbi:DUF4873 domain-containing protein [Pseudonocardia sp. Cha107L01]|jgi:hypothetical protein|uniref:DUF4873 domain-containing protein n=1 Tax=Pseudonocardia sp. Cha107L01 TaxID=3457576 RepID=UPI00403E5861
MASYNGPAMIVSRGGEIEVTVDLRSRTDPDGSETWAGHIDHGDRSELTLVVKSMSQYGLMIRLPDGHEGHVLLSAETAWSAGSITVSGFLRG